jgi:hypothetical protein
MTHEAGFRSAGSLSKLPRRPTSPCGGAAPGDEIATLLSATAGRPKDVRRRDRTVHTGAWKHPVDAPPAGAPPQYRR